MRSDIRIINSIASLLRFNIGVTCQRQNEFKIFRPIS